MDKRKRNKDELGNKTGSVTVTIKKEKYLKIKEKSDRLHVSITQLIDDMVTRDIENAEFLKKTAPALSLLNITEENVVILDVSKSQRRMAEIIIRNGKYVCLLDESDSCKHIKFMLILPVSVKFKHKVKSL